MCSVWLKFSHFERDLVSMLQNIFVHGDHGGLSLRLRHDGRRRVTEQWLVDWRAQFVKKCLNLGMGVRGCWEFILVVSLYPRNVFLNEPVHRFHELFFLTKLDLIQKR